MISIKSIFPIFFSFSFAPLFWLLFSIILSAFTGAWLCVCLIVLHAIRARAFQSNNSLRNRRLMFTVRHSIRSTIGAHFRRKETVLNSMKAKQKKRRKRQQQKKSWNSDTDRREQTRTDFFLLPLLLSLLVALFLLLYRIPGFMYIVFCFHARNFPRMRIVL